MSDPVNNPAHYNQGDMEFLTAVDGLGLDFYQGQIMKYVVRYQHKHETPELQIQDLKKAKFYLNRLIIRASYVHNQKDQP